jgi:hypothetical protein
MMRLLVLVFLAMFVSCQYNVCVSINGDDKWSGSNPYPNAGKTDGPFKTIQRAQKYVRDLKTSVRVLKSAVTVSILPGVYQLSETLMFTPSDSGSSGAPVIYKRFEKESGSVVISSCKNITSKWTTIQRGSDTLLRTVIDDVKKGLVYPNTLFINNLRRPRARSPIRHYAQPIPNSKLGFYYSGDDLRQYGNMDDANIILYHSWTASRHFIKSLDVSNKTVTFTSPTLWNIGSFSGISGNRFYVENVYEELDSLGGTTHFNIDVLTI